MQAYLCVRVVNRHANCALSCAAEAFCCATSRVHEVDMRGLESTFLAQLVRMLMFFFEERAGLERR